MTATKKGDARELLVLLWLLNVNIKNTTTNRNKRTVLRKNGDVKNHYNENELAKPGFYALIQGQNVACWKFLLSHDIRSK